MNDNYDQLLTLIVIICTCLAGLFAGMFVYSYFVDERPRSHKETVCFLHEDGLTHCLDIEDYNEMIKGVKSSQ